MRLPPFPRPGEFRSTLQMAVGRGLVDVVAATGDPAAKVLSHRPVPDPYPEYERMRARGELYRSRLGVYFTASHAVCTTVLRGTADWHVVTAEFAPVTWDHDGLAHPIDHSLLALNPPDHTRLRRVVAPWFTPRAVRRWEDRIQRTVTGFLDALAEREQFDLVTEFATRVPIRVICDLLGVDDARHADFARWGEVAGGAIDGVRSLTEWRAVGTAVREMTDYFTDLIEARRRNPGDDVVSGLIENGAEFTARDLTATAGLLLGAGFETTRNLIGNGVLAFLRNPGQAALLRENPDLAANAVEEVLRYDSPVQSTGRLAVADTELAGAPFPRRHMVAVMLGGANRDPAVFTDPARFDISRENARDHLAFSAGVHYCLGSGLARLEGEIALRELFLRFPDLHGAAPAVRRRSRILRGLASLPMHSGARATVIA